LGVEMGASFAAQALYAPACDSFHRHHKIKHLHHISGERQQFSGAWVVQKRNRRTVFNDAALFFAMLPDIARSASS